MNFLSADFFIVIIKLFWPLIIFIMAFPFFLRTKSDKSESIKMEEIDSMDGKTFEEFLGLLFKNLGYKVEITRYSGDFGADLILQKRRKRIVVQAKRYSNNLGVDAIKEAYTAQKYYKCNTSMVVTNSHYTKQAKKLAKATEVILWNREKLSHILNELENKGKPVSWTGSNSSSSSKE